MSWVLSRMSAQAAASGGGRCPQIRSRSWLAEFSVTVPELLPQDRLHAVASSRPAPSAAIGVPGSSTDHPPASATASGCPNHRP